MSRREMSHDDRTIGPDSHQLRTGVIFTIVWAHLSDQKFDRGDLIKPSKVTGVAGSHKGPERELAIATGKLNPCRVSLMWIDNDCEVWPGRFTFDCSHGYEVEPIGVRQCDPDYTKLAGWSLFEGATVVRVIY